MRVGCSGVPAGLRRDRYFEKLDYLECPETFANPPRAKVLKSWREGAGSETHFGILATRTITHAPGSRGFEELAKELWPEAGRYGNTAVVRSAVDHLLEQVQWLGAEVVLFRSPPDLSRSSEDRLRQFFSEVATAERFGEVARAWEPGDLWPPDAGFRLCRELGLVPVLDPLAENPLGETAPSPLDICEEDERVYLRIRPIGRARERVPGPDLEDLAERLAEREGWIAFGNVDKNRDARALRDLLSAA